MLTSTSTLLHAYFSLRISPLTEDRINTIQTKLLKMSKHFIALHQCNEKLQRKPGSRKLHASVCLIHHFLRDFGTLDKADTASYESVHRVMTVGAWQKTSKRFDSMNEEMSKQCLLHNFKGINDIIQAVTTNSVDEYIKKRGPYVPPDNVIPLSVSNMKTFPLQVSVNNINWLISTDHTVLRLLDSAGLNTELFSATIREKLTDDNIYGWDELSNNDHDKKTLTLVQARLIGTVELVKIYCMPLTHFTTKDRDMISLWLIWRKNHNLPKSFVS